MSVTDTYVANDVIYRLLENGNADANFTGGTPLLTSMFTTTEIVDSMNRVQQAFLLETGMIVTRTTITPEVGKPKYDLPVDCIRPRRVTWSDSSPGGAGFGQGGFGQGGFGGMAILNTKALTQVDTWELDAAAHDWPSDRDTPIAWYENALPQQQLGIAKTPLNDGVVGLLYVALATTLTGAGIAFTVPDDWTPYILYGTLAELLGSDGPSYDPVRANWCSQRFNEGIELARLVLGGPS